MYYAWPKTNLRAHKRWLARGIWLVEGSVPEATTSRGERLSKHRALISFDVCAGRVARVNCSLARSMRGAQGIGIICVGYVALYV